MFENRWHGLNYLLILSRLHLSRQRSGVGDRGRYAKRIHLKPNQ
jgi:hypothetical protein